MNRNYLPPSLMHTGHNSSNMSSSSSSGSGAGLHHPQPQLESIQDEDDDDSTEMTETVPVGVDVTQNGSTNVLHQQQSPQYQMHQLYGAFNNNNNQGTSTALPQQPMHAASVSSVISPSSSSSAIGGALSNPPATTTRRSVSFTGGVPIVSHPFQHQYTHMLPPMAPQMAHQSSTYQYQQSMGQVVAGGGNGTGTPPNQPIRLGRIDRFSRTCKLPTVQEVGKLKWATS